jgi:hypothetical protein
MAQVDPVVPAEVAAELPAEVVSFPVLAPMPELVPPLDAPAVPELVAPLEAPALPELEAFPPPLDGPASPPLMPAPPPPPLQETVANPVVKKKIVPIRACAMTCLFAFRR